MCKTRHYKFVAAQSVYTLESIMDMFLFNGKPVCALEVKCLFFSFFKTTSTFAERSNLSIVGYYFCMWKYSLKTALLLFLLVALTQRREHDVVKECRIQKKIFSARVCCPRVDHNMRPIARERLQSRQQERLLTYCDE